MVKVSVLMANYNTPPTYLKRAIESVLDQTFKDFELVIVNDGSADGSRDILYEYAEKDERIKIVENEQNLGLPKSLNRGIDRCSGEYVARMDTDDICYAKRLEKQVAFMDSHPEMILSGAWADVFSKSEDVIDKSWDMKMCPMDEYRIRLMFGSAPLLVHPTVIYRRALLDKYDLRYPEDIKYKYAEDYKMWTECSSFGEVGIMEEAVIKYRNAEDESRITVRHEREMRQCIYEIQSDQLRKIGVSLSEEWFKYNDQLLRGRKPYDKKYKKWINLVLRGNKKYKVYPQKLLKNLLHDRWYSIVYYGIAYEKSPLKRLSYFLSLYSGDKIRFIKEISKKR